MVKVTIAAVDRGELETKLMEEKDTKYVVAYPTYESILKKPEEDDGVDYTVGSTFLAPSNDEGGTCTNMMLILSESNAPARYFAFRSAVASLAAYCKSKKINLVVIPACLLSQLADSADRDMVFATVKEIFTLAGCGNMNVVITPVMIDDDRKVTGVIETSISNNKENDINLEKLSTKMASKKNKSKKKDKKKKSKKKNKKR